MIDLSFGPTAEAIPVHCVLRLMTILTAFAYTGCIQAALQQGI